MQFSSPKIALTSLVFTAVTITGAYGQEAPAISASALTVELVMPSVEKWPQVVPASGWLAPWQEAIISSETSGLKIANIIVDVGSSVRRGDLLAELSSESVVADLQKQQAAVETAEAKLDEANANVDRARQLEGTGALSGQLKTQYMIAQRTAQASVASEKAGLDSEKIKLRQTRIIAPDDGIVSSRSATLGAVVSAGAEMFRLIRQSRVEWQAEVPTQLVNSVHQGQAAHIKIANDLTLNGIVRLVSPTVAKETGRAIVYVTLAEGAAQSGQFAVGGIDIAVTQSLAVPQTAIIQRDGLNYVFVLADANHVQRKPIEVGRRQGNLVEITAGIGKEAPVVKAGGAFLADGSNVKVVQGSEAEE